MNRWKRFVPLILVFVFISIGIWNKSFFFKNDDPYGVFRSNSKNNLKPDVYFKESHNEIGIDHFNNSEQPGTFVFPLKISAGVVITDLNNDGHPDLVFNLNFDEDIIAVYINDGHGKFKRFRSPAFSRSYLNFPLPQYPNAVAAFDFDNNGTQDILIAGFRKVFMLKNDGKLNFSDASKETGLADLAGPFININLFDYNSDGFVDVLLLTQSIFEKGNNAHPILLLNHGKNFENLSANFLNKFNNDYSWSSILGYISNVHSNKYLERGIFKPDIFIQNDYTPSRYYVWDQHKNIYLAKNKFLPKSPSHGQMGGDVTDLFNDGRDIVYSSNAPIPLFKNGFNYLMNMTAGKELLSFEEEAYEHKIESCGFSWGARYFDANNDGRSDIFVSNGGFNYGKEPMWYNFVTWLSVPYFLRGDKDSNPLFAKTNLASSEPNCLFIQNDKNEFIDVAQSSGIDDLLDGRGVATGDLNGDGLVDLAVANFHGPPSIYINQSKINHWIGFRMKRNNHQSNIGSIFTLKTNKFSTKREFFPNNGLGAQNEDMIHFGLGEAEPISLEVRLVGSEKSLEFTNLKKDRYNIIYEPKK
jgi:hypothetical protein